FLCGFALFSACGCKRPVYLVPVWPPLALALGCYLDRRLASVGWSGLWQRPSALARGIAVTALSGGGLSAGAAAVAGLLEPAHGVRLAAAGTLGGLTLVARRQPPSWAAGAAVAFVVLFAGVLLLQPAYNQRFALRAGLHHHAGLTELGQVPVFCYPQRWDSV